MPSARAQVTIDNHDAIHQIAALLVDAAEEQISAPHQAGSASA